ncbi:hypothetical protein WN73_06955 [Bradyrhizobium sp. CCBAU 45394]|uniref:hypothetical protein n=1 Tax=Bradyrhizobium sp. CCBAU 45394 TaxID=1325087 RepID=UPI002303DD03|nr:hypothetical protein [Bradyrhizobium sp. CCBAU 45394]MDA9390440.1 hypothetical protein [Bradyrhizobium sp. CCBAU 45394]
MIDGRSPGSHLQLALFSGAEHGPKTRRARLWIVAAETPIAISERHHYAFVNSMDGTSVVDQSDLLLLRNRSGAFLLFGPAQGSHLLKDIAAFSASLPERIASSSRTGVTEMMVISSRPARWRDASRAELRMENARSNLEEILFRLEQYASKPARLSTLGTWAIRLGSEIHPMVRALFHRIYADALAQAYRQSGGDDWRLQARLNYRLAQLNSQNAGLFHYFRTAHDTGESVLAGEQLDLPGLEDGRGRRASSIGFSVERVCGFAIELDQVDGPAVLARGSSATVYRHYGSVQITDQTLVKALAGLQSPSRRLVASTRFVGTQLAVTTGVVDEIRALLRIDDQTEPRGQVEAIQASSDTIAFEPPWIVRPADFVTFIGRAEARRHHDLSVRAVMADGFDLHLSIRLDAKNSAAERHL